MKKTGTARDGDKVARSSYDKALDLLARREHSARELGTKLAVRGHSKDEAREAIELLKDQHYQSDERFADSLARRRAGQGYGPRRIEAELKSHGLRDPAVKAAIAAVDVDWREVAAAQLRRHYGTAPADRETRAKRAGFLLRRGFDAATVRAVTRADIGDPGPDFD